MPSASGGAASGRAAGDGETGDGETGGGETGGGETGGREGERSGAIGGADNEITAHTQAPAAHGAEAREESFGTPGDPIGALAQVEQPEKFADMQDKSRGRPFNPLASIWSAAPVEGRVEGPANADERADEKSMRGDSSTGPVRLSVPSDPEDNHQANANPTFEEDVVGRPLISATAAGTFGTVAADRVGATRLATGRDVAPGRSGIGHGNADLRLDPHAPQAAKRSDEPQPALFEKSDRRSNIIEPESDLPRFSPVSSGPAPRDPLSSHGGSEAAQTKIWEAFTPSRPKYTGRLFAGRRWALQRIITAVEQDHAHIIIYGPRGIGKTSLANVLAESASEVEYQVLRFPCGSNATYEEIFRGLLGSLPADHLDRATQARFAGVQNLGQLLPDGDFGPTDVTAVLSQIKLDHAILIIDEFDRVESKHLKNQIAETIKNLSDASARVTFIIIGIAHSLDELIGMHPSIQRHLVGIHLPLMTEAELEHVILAGEDASGIRFEDMTRNMVVAFSKGLPYFAQLLSLHAGRTALKRGSMLVQMEDLRDALELVLVESDPLARASYDAATREETDQLMIDVLFAAATATCDDYGTFTVENAAEMFLNSKGKKRPESELRKALEELAQQEESRIIETWPAPTAEVRYAFVLQTMRQYILLRQAVRRGLM